MHLSTVILTAFLTATLTAAGTVVLMQRGGMLAPAAAEDGVVVPTLVGLTEADARANAASSHVAVLVGGREASRDARPGTVIRQSIPAGQRVPRDAPVSVVIAAESLEVPSVAGQDIAEATARLEQAGYRVVVGDPRPDPSVPEGRILDQTPLAGAPLDKGGSVTLRASSGPAAVEVPRVAGLVLGQAKAQLEEVGLKPVVEWVSVAESQGLVVMSQDPAAGQKAKPGSEIRIVTNR